jgi:hypothetical protein
VTIVFSGLAGVFCAWLLSCRLARIFSAVFPWLGVLTWLLYEEYLMPGAEGGASMWPVALLFLGGVAAGVGFAACMVCQGFLRRLM